MEKCGETKPRTWLFKQLEDVIGVAHKKCTCNAGNRAHVKLGWARVLVSAVGTYGVLLKDHDLEDLAQEIEEIKKRLEM
jgi:hypothetical protein